MTMKISVFIPIYNGEKDIPDLIQCLENQTYDQDKVEYLLIDNNSDRTLSILQNIAENSPINIHILREKKHSKFLRSEKPRN